MLPAEQAGLYQSLEEPKRRLASLSRRELWSIPKKGLRRTGGHGKTETSGLALPGTLAG